MSADAGDVLVNQVVAQIGPLSADEQAAVYGAGHAFAAGSDAPIAPTSAGWIATILGDFRTAPCRFCDHGLLEHTLSASDQGPSVTCDADGGSRMAWEWHAGPRPRSAWLLVLAVVLWVGLPLATVGLASWVMPLVSAVFYRRRTWGAAAAIWAALTILLVVLIEAEAVPTLTGFLALLIWFGSAVYGGFQIKPWLAAMAQRRQN